MVDAAHPAGMDWSERARAAPTMGTSDDALHIAELVGRPEKAVPRERSSQGRRHGKGLASTVYRTRVSGDDVGMQFMVSSSPHVVSAWSRARLPFQPLGWHRQLRDELRTALRLLSATGGGGLIAEYHAPDRAFVDLENVLLYNVGMSVFAPLITAGLTCRRGIEPVRQPV